MIARWAGAALVVVLTVAANSGAAQEWTPQPVPLPAPAKAPAKAPAAAPATAPAKKQLSARDKAILDFAHQQGAQTDKTYLAAEQPADTTTLDPKYAAAYNDYAIGILKHDRDTYNWNHTSSVIIFYMVMFLVLSGVWFSWMQFRIAHHPATAQRTVSTATATPVTTDGAALATTGPTPPAAIVTQQQDSVT